MRILPIVRSYGVATRLTRDQLFRDVSEKSGIETQQFADLLTSYVRQGQVNQHREAIMSILIQMGRNSSNEQ